MVQWRNTSCKQRSAVCTSTPGFSSKTPSDMCTSKAPSNVRPATGHLWPSCRNGTESVSEVSERLPARTPRKKVQVCFISLSLLQAKWSFGSGEDNPPKKVHLRIDLPLPAVGLVECCQLPVLCLRARRLSSPRTPEAFVITFFVMFIAQLAYFAKATSETHRTSPRLEANKALGLRSHRSHLVVFGMPFP